MSQLDVSCDWLYRTKHRSKKKSGKSPSQSPNPTPTPSPSPTPTPTNTRHRRRRSTSVSNAALSSDTTADPVMTPLTPVSSAGASGANATALKLTKVLTSSPKASAQTPAAQAKPSRSTSLSSSTTKAGFMAKPVKRSLFGSLFRKGTGPSTNAPTPGPTPLTSIDTAMDSPATSATSAASPSRTPTPQPITPTALLPGLALASVSLKRVAFSLAAMAQEPPQQLPSRQPRRGNVVVPADLLEGTAAISQGIAQGPGLGLGPGPSASSGAALTEASPEYRAAVDAQRAQQREAQMHMREAHVAAKRIAHEVEGYAKGETPGHAAGDTPVDTPVDAPALGPALGTHTLRSIDTPIHAHLDHFGHDAEAHPDADAHPDTSLEVVYTRCCHLREILPIPSTLRQLQGKAAPLQTLRFSNSRPTLIDVLSFCDFVSVSRVSSLAFDNVALTGEMLRAVLCAAAACGGLERLSLRNVPIAPGEWPLVCRLVQLRPRIARLDLSQTTVRQAGASAELRHSLDWALFVQAVGGGRPSESGDSGESRDASRGFDELLLNGVKFSRGAASTRAFPQLLQSLRLHGQGSLRLGLASCELSQQQSRDLLDWMAQGQGTSFCVEGVDLGYNDLGPCAKTMCNRLATLSYPSLHYFTLNSTSLPRAYDAALLIKYLARLPDLQFLDISGLPQLFPDILPYLHKYLPRFKQLRRLHCDNNDLPYKELTVVASILAKCEGLTHVSLQQQTPNVEVASFAQNNCWATLYNLARSNRSLVNLDINYDAVPEAIQSRIALALVSNMNRAVQGTAPQTTDELAAQDDLLFDGALLSDTAEQVLHKLNALAHPASAPAQSIDQTKKYLLKKYFEKMQHVQADVRHKVDAMFARRRTEAMPLQEKENLVRLLLLERNLENVLALCAHIPQFNALAPRQLQQREVDTAAQRPHLMATDSGRTVDVFTGKPVLCRASSSTLVHGREQEQEEGELHRWGVFVQQQNDIYPGEIPSESTTPLAQPAVEGTSEESRGSSAHPAVESSEESRGSSAHPAVESSEESRGSSAHPDAQESGERGSSAHPDAQESSGRGAQELLSPPGHLPPDHLPLVTKIPSGTNLRTAIMRAKGIDSIAELISNVNSHTVDLGSIYAEETRESEPGACEGVDETYERLLNGIERAQRN